MKWQYKTAAYYMKMFHAFLDRRDSRDDRRHGGRDSWRDDRRGGGRWGGNRGSGGSWGNKGMICIDFSFLKDYCRFAE